MTDKGAAGRESRETRGGTIPGTNGHPAFRLSQAFPAPLPILLTVPHGGRTYPDDLAALMRDPATTSLRLEDRFTDLLGEAVARETGVSLLIAHAPRAMIDLNRAPDDIDWEMVSGGARGNCHHAAGRRARSGLGLVPRRLPGFGELWRGRITHHDLTARVEQVHRPYHGVLAASLETLRDRWGSALLIDLHSMPPLGTKRGADAAPDFVIGDRFGAACASSLSAAAIDYIQGGGRKAAYNRPYAGGYVLDRHAAPARGIHALQLEVCRTLYLDKQWLEPGPGLPEVARIIGGLVRRLADELACWRSLAQAAE